MKTWMITALMFLTLAASAQQKHVISVTEAVDLAFKNVIELKNAKLDYSIQEAKNREIFGQALPQVSANGGLQYYLKVPQILFPNAAEAGIYSVLLREGLVPAGTVIPPPTVQSVSFQQPWNASASATLQQLLFQPDVFVGLQARKTALQVSTAAIEQAEERVKDSAYRKYYAILIAERQLSFIDSSLTRLRRLYRDDSLAFINGFRERLDLDRTRLQLNNLQTTRDLVESGVRISYGVLKFSLGIPQSDTVVLTGALTPDSIRQDLLVDSFRYEDRADIRSLQAIRDLNQLDVKRNKLGYLPTVALGANYSIVGQGQKFVTNSSTFWYRSAYVGLSVNLPIFDGFQRKYRIRQSQLNVEKLDNAISQVKQGIDLQQVASRESLTIALNSLDNQQENLELARRVYNTTKLKWDQGLGSSTEILLAELELQNAQSNYYNALYNAVIARVSYQASLGRL